MRLLESDPDGSKSWIIGVILGSIGSISINLGNNIQSLGLKQMQMDTDRKTTMIRLKTNPKISFPNKNKIVPEDGNEDLQKNEELIPISPKGKPQAHQRDETNQISPAKPKFCFTWFVGTAIFLSGSMLNFASFAFAAQSMLASLESIQFVTNLLFGKLILGAEVTRSMLLGTFLTVAGTIFTVQFSSKTKIRLGSDELKVLYTNPIYIAFLCCMVVMLVILHLIYENYEKHQQSNSPKKNSEIIMPLTYSIWSAIFGTQSVVQAKVLAELLAVQSNGDENIFESWFIYVTILMWVLTVGVWLSRLNNALSKFDTLFIIPLLQCNFIFFAIVSGGIFFQEFDDFAASQWLGFWSGVLIMLSGLVLLTPSRAKTSSELPTQNEDTDLIPNENDVNDSSNIPSEGTILNKSMNMMQTTNDVNNPSERFQNEASCEKSSTCNQKEHNDLQLRTSLENILTTIRNGCLTSSIGSSSVLSSVITTETDDAENDTELRIIQNFNQAYSILTDDSIENGSMNDDLNNLRKEIIKQIQQLDDRRKEEFVEMFQELNDNDEIIHSLSGYIRQMHFELQSLKGR